MTKEEEQGLLDAITWITSEHDRKVVMQRFVSEIHRILNAQSVILMNIPRGQSSGYLELDISLPEQAYLSIFKPHSNAQYNHYVEIDDHTDKVLTSASMVKSDHYGFVRMDFPLFINKALSGILSVLTNEQSDETVAQVSKVIAIYNSFMSIIDDGERDALTRLLNRKTFDIHLAELVNGAHLKSIPRVSGERRIEKEEKTYHWVGILDIDHFKCINDNFGHMYGDEVLLLFSNLMGNTFRSNDLLFRYGGEEFVVVLAPTTEQYAAMVFERFRSQLEAFRFPQIGQVTVSIGMVRIDENVLAASLLDHADQALYYAKQHGRNQVCNYHQLVHEGILESKNMEVEIDYF